jgi:hypothetical protein
MGGKMDMVAMAAAVVTLLAPYCAKMADKVSGLVVDAAVDKVGELYQAVKDNFRGNPVSKAALEGLNLGDPSTQAEMQNAVEEALKEAPFAEQIVNLLNAIEQKTGQKNVFNNAFHGNVGKVIQTGPVGTLNIS